jgi:hypothetical protein
MRVLSTRVRLPLAVALQMIDCDLIASSALHGIRAH